ncbi:MAG: carbohydrate kinase family protein [Pirellulales bacterium]|nr:carbohydrate kinase family protein [Pirellulales bacterium]
MPDVGCAGILVADTICGPIKRLPRSGELLSVGPMPSKIGGCAANVALDLAKQGVAVEICGCIGDDEAGAGLLQSIAATGVGCEQIRRVASQPTSKTVIVLVEGEDRRFLHNFGANAVFDVGQIRREWIDRLKVFYLGGLFAMPAVRMSELAELLKYCRLRGVTSVVDVVVPAEHSGMGELSSVLPYIDYFLPNDDEARRLTGVDTPEKQIEIFLRHGAKAVVVTCGPNGAIAAIDSCRWKAESYRVEGIDPSGAGDAFAAGIVTGILRRWDMSETLRYAAALGASATTALGTTDGVFTAAETASFLEQHPLRVERIS